MTTDNPALPQIPARALDSHKGDFGRVLLLGGSRGMTGAVSLAGLAALRGGAGLVRLGVAESCLPIVAGFEPSYMTSPLPEDAAGRIAEAALEEILALAVEATAVAIGPGLGRSPGLQQIVAKLYTALSIPLVIDADGLNALAEQPAILEKPGGPRILTPHPGEFARLAGAALAGEARRQRAVELAAQWGVILVLKGHQTLITDGQRQATNTTGNPSMATGGTGDVLTGLTTALICQHLSLWDAARLAVHVHGRAGDLAAKELGEVSLIASDLIRYLPAALLEVTSSRE